MTAIDLTAITLARGSHPADCSDPEMCLFEAYNVITRDRHTDSRPPGVSGVLHQFGMSLNDVLPDDRRQELKRFLPNGADRLAGTESDGKDETRSYIALDWFIRTYTSAWLDLGGLAAAAAALRDLRRITDNLAAAQTAGPVIRDARSDASAAWAAAWAAAGDAAWAAAGAAAGDAAGAAAWAAAGAAAGDAAGDAAWAAAGAAARAAAGAAAWAAAGDAARAAAGAAAWAAARDAARAAAGAAARAAAGDAARAKLAPTVADLQTSAIALYDVLITGEAP
jgi:hypothetical protein